MAVLTKSLFRGALLAFLVSVLVACGSDDAVTDAGASSDSSADSAETAESTEPTSTTAAEDDHGDDDDHSDDDHSDEEDHDDHDGEDKDHDDHDEDKDHDDHDDSSGGLGAHEHGVADLSVAWGEGELLIDLVSPTYNIFGFESEPSTDEERELVAERTDALTQPGVITINSEAGCERADVSTELEYEGSHAELTASWLFTCTSLDQLEELDAAALFAEFPNFEDIDAQWASPDAQSAAELSPASTVLSLG